MDDVAEVQVHRFGSVPLKTYLPHGDLDVTAFAPDDKWLSKVHPPKFSTGFASLTKLDFCVV